MDVVRSRVGSPGQQFAHEPPFTIGGATIDPATREVRIGSETERIQLQPLRVLMALRQHQGRLVTRDEIAEQCWDGRIVGDDVINRAVLILRKVAKRAGGFWIETIPRGGYRLVEAEISAAGFRQRAYTWALVLVCLVAVVLGADLYLSSQSDPAASPTIGIVPVAVTTQGRDSGQLAGRLERAMMDALHESGFRIAPPESGDLVVSAVVSRGAAGKSKVDLTVSAGPQRAPVMSSTFERSNDQLDDLPPQVAAAAVEILQATGWVLTLDGRVSDTAFVSRMLAGMKIAAQGDALRSYQMAVQAAREYPDSVGAELALAITSAATLEAFTVPERRAHAQTARDILERREEYAPRFGDYAHAWCLLRPRSWLEACERKLRDTLDKSRVMTSSGQRLSELLADVGRFEEAARIARIASARNPYSAQDSGTLLQLLEIQGLHREAETIYAAASRKWPDSWVLRWNRLVGLTARGDFASLEKFASTIPGSEFTFDADTLRSALAAHRTGDRTQLIKSCGQEKLRGSTRQACIALFAAAGDLDRSFEMAFALYPKQVGRNSSEEEALWLNQPAYYMMSLLSAPAGAPLRRDPRFLQLANQTGLVRYWRAAHAPDFCLGSQPEPVCSQIQRRPS